MADENPNGTGAPDEEPTTPPQAETTGNDANPSADNEGKTLTQDEVNKIIQQRLARERKNWEKEAAQRASEAAERAKLDETERVKLELEEARKASEAATQRAVNAERRAALTGKVADPTAALKLLNPEAHLTEDDQVDVEALLADYPFLKPQTGTTPVEPTNPPKGKRGLTEDQINRMTPEEINKRWDEVQEVLSRK